MIRVIIETVGSIFAVTDMPMLSMVNQGSVFRLFRARCPSAAAAFSAKSANYELAAYFRNDGDPRRLCQVFGAWRGAPRVLPGLTCAGALIARPAGVAAPPSRGRRDRPRGPARGSAPAGVAAPPSGGRP